MSQCEFDPPEMRSRDSGTGGELAMSCTGPRSSMTVGLIRAVWIAQLVGFERVPRLCSLAIRHGPVASANLLETVEDGGRFRQCR